MINPELRYGSHEAKRLKRAQILHCITGTNIGGAEVMLCRLLSSLKATEYGAEVLSLLAPGPVAAGMEAIGVNVRSLGMNRNTIGIASVLRGVRTAREVAPDLFHGWMYHGNLMATLGSWSFGGQRPSIWSVHHSLADLKLENPMTQKIIRLSAWLSNRTSAIIYCSRVSAEDHERVGYCPRQRFIIPNGVDCDEFQPASGAKSELVRLLGIPPSRLVVGNVARFHPMKDQTGLVRAVAQLLKTGLDLQCVLIGAGHVEDGPVKSTARELGVADRVSVLDGRDDIAKLMPGLDVYVSASAWGEAFSLSIIEAMASGVPTVVTDVGDSGWQVEGCGVIVPPRDSVALARGLMEVLSLSAEERQQLGAKARRRVIDKFSLEQCTRSHIALYERVMSSK